MVKTYKKHNDQEQYHKGISSYEELWKNILIDLNAEPNLTTINDITQIHISLFTPIEDMPNLVKKLKENHNLYLLSNQLNTLLPAIKNNYQFLDIFINPVFSNEVGMCKPNLDIYQYLINQNNIDPAESIFIDNNQENLNPAKELGINTILFENQTQLEKDLNHNLNN